MDVHLHGACMGKLVGPAGGGGGGAGGAGGGGISTQFRLLPNSQPSECYPVDAEKVPVATNRPALHLRVSSTPHRTFSTEPLKIPDEYLSTGSNSPVLDIVAGFLLTNNVAGRVQMPSLTHASSPVSSPSLEFKGLRFSLDGEGAAPETPEAENLLLVN